MLGALMSSPLLLLPAMLVGGFCFFRSLTSWAAALRLLILAVLFGGIIAVREANGSAAIIFRDLCIVLPLYLALFSSAAGSAAAARIPSDILIYLVLLLTYLALASMLSVVSVPPFEVLIGLKVWVCYLPFIAVGIAVASSPERLFGTLRFLLLAGLIPCGIGLLQAALVRIIGYETAIGLFYGNAAPMATQSFQVYDAAGGIYRIPATFSNVSQYVQFLYLFIFIAVIEANADPLPKIRQIAQVAIAVTVVAGLFSGTKGAALGFFGLLAAFAGLGLIGRRFVLMLPVAALAAAWALNAGGLDLVSLFSFGQENLDNYMSDQGLIGQVRDATQYGAFGAGIGTSTVAARYGIAGASNTSGFNLGYEVWYAKIIAELGTAGFAIYMIFLVGILLRSIVAVMRNWGRSSHPVVAPLSLYVLFNLVYSYKASVIDTDPGNIFFWLALGMMIRVDQISHAAVASRDPVERRDTEFAVQRSS